jgi:signal transduction histidine kinase
MLGSTESFGEAVSAFFERDRLARIIGSDASTVRGLGLQGLLGRLVETAFVATGAGYAALAVLDSEREKLEWYVTRGRTEDDEPAIRSPLQLSGPAGLMMRHPGLLRISDSRMHRFLGAPVLIGDDACGSLYIADKRDGGFDDGDEQWVLTLAAWAAIAIEHERLLAAAGGRQSTLERVVRTLSATQDFAVAVGAETDLSRVLELVAQRGRALVEARSFVILLRGGDGDDDLVVVAAAGVGEPTAGARIPIAGSTAGQVMLGQRPARTSNVDQKLLVSPESFGMPHAQSALLVPMIYRGQTLGVVVAFDRSQQSVVFTEDDEQVLLAFAGSAATAVATAQSVRDNLVRTSLDAAEAERKHWARELHDETLHGLARLKVLAASSRHEGNLGRVRMVLDEIVSGLQIEVENVHTIMRELRPAALDDFGLRAALEALAHRHRVVYGIEVVCNLGLPDPVSGDRRLAPELETIVYRIVQEALNNVAKHAHALRVTIAATTTSEVMVEISDDGVGFDVSVAHAGFGMIGMQERAAMGGGTIDVNSVSDGTTVRVALPARFGSVPTESFVSGQVKALGVAARPVDARART